MTTNETTKQPYVRMVIGEATTDAALGEFLKTGITNRSTSKPSRASLSPEFSPRKAAT